MGILSTSASIIQYRVEGRLAGPIIDRVRTALKKHAIADIDNTPSDKSIGWVCFNDPFSVDFDQHPFLIGTQLVFSMRIDKKTIPAKIVQKHYNQSIKQRLKDSGREFLSRNEKKEIKDHVINALNLRIPATPNTYDVVWKYETADLWFFSHLKGANEELETLFSRSFQLKLIRLFPYTMATMASTLADEEKDAIKALTPTRFTEA